MECKHCGADNGSVKKCCHQCGKVLEGYIINNVTGKLGYRNDDGSFTAGIVSVNADLAYSITTKTTFP